MKDHKETDDVPIREIHCKSALHKLKRRIPYGWDLNVYRGCQHRCSYCYAMYSFTPGDCNQQDNAVYVKTNIVEVLERELSSPGWKREIVNIGGVTDSYQPAEARYRLMPRILKLLIKYKTPAIISTKSDLVLQDYDLIDELSRITYINVAASITTMDECVRQKIEPGAVESSERFAMLKAFRKTNASVGLHAMPIIPCITDSRENITQICRCAKDARVHYMLTGTMYLRGKTRGAFLDTVKQRFPQTYDALTELYKRGGAGKAYKEELYRMVNALRNEYDLSGSYSKQIKEKMHTS